MVNNSAQRRAASQVHDVNVRLLDMPSRNNAQNNGNCTDRNHGRAN